ncbi:MAG: hypothetical protein ACO3EO_03480 [Candidatus Kapaibacteriota bacterium]
MEIFVMVAAQIFKYIMIRMQITYLIGLIFLLLCTMQEICLAQQNNDSLIVLRYAVQDPMNYTYGLKSMVSQSLGEMIDFNAKTSATTELNLSTKKDKYIEYTYSYMPGTVTLSGLSIAGIPDTTFTSNGPLVPSIKEMITPKGIVIQRFAGETASNVPGRSEQLMQSLTQGARYFLLEFPKDPIKIGSTWNIRKSDTVGTQTQEGKSTIILYTELDCKVIRTTIVNGIRNAFIECGSNALGLSGNIEQQGITMTIDGEGSAKGTYAIDLDTGLPIDATLLMDYELRMAATGQEQMIVPIQMTMETMYQRLRSISMPQKSNTSPQGKRP